MRAPTRAPRGPEGEEEAAATGPAVWPAPMLGLCVPSSPQVTPKHRDYGPDVSKASFRLDATQIPHQGGPRRKEAPRSVHRIFLNRHWELPEAQSPRRLHLTLPVTLLRGKQNRNVYFVTGTLSKSNRGKGGTRSSPWQGMEP